MVEPHNFNKKWHFLLSYIFKFEKQSKNFSYLAAVQNCFYSGIKIFESSIIIEFNHSIKYSIFSQHLPTYKTIRQIKYVGYVSKNNIHNKRLDPIATD